HLQDAVAGAFGDPESGAMPSWALAAGGIPVGGNIINVDTPLISAAETVAPIPELAKWATGQGGSAQESLQGLLGPVGGLQGGALEGLTEAAVGRSTFTGAPISTAEALTSAFIPFSGRLRSTMEAARAAGGGSPIGLAELLGVGVTNI